MQNALGALRWIVVVGSAALPLRSASAHEPLPVLPPDTPLRSVAPPAPVAAPTVDDAPVADSGPSPGPALWTEPVALFVLSSKIYATLGAQWPVFDGAEGVVQATFTQGRWLDCRSESTGGWLELGVVFMRRDGFGPFVQPEVLGRYFHTGGGRVSEEGAWFSAGCTAQDLANLNASDGELHVGADAGVVLLREPVHLAFAGGVHFGPCWNCVPGTFFHGDVSLFGRAQTARSDHVTLGLTLTLLRLGIGF